MYKTVRWVKLFLNPGIHNLNDEIQLLHTSFHVGKRQLILNSLDVDNYNSDTLDGGGGHEEIFYLPNVIKQKMIKYLERELKVFGSWKFN